MTSYDLQHLLTLRPFRPLRIHFLEGEVKEVRHPEFAWCAGDMLFIGGGRMAEGRLVVEELDAIYGINFIKKVEVIEAQPATTGGSNGSSESPHAES